MKNYILFLLLLTCSLLRGQAAFRHITTANNTSGHITTLDNSKLNGDPNAIIFIMPVYNKNGTEQTGIDFTLNTGVWFNGKNWTIFNQNTKANMPIGVTFNVLVAPKSDANVFTHICTKANTGGSGGTFSCNTIIDNKATNDNPNALLLITQTFKGQYNDNACSVSYGGNKWNIGNAITSPNELGVNPLINMPIGAAFNVMVINKNQVPGFDEKATAFMHTATVKNISKNITFLNAPSVNKNPDALIFATHNWGWGNGASAGQTAGPSDKSTISAWYSVNNGSAWAIYNTTTGVMMPDGAKFNVVAASISTIAPPNPTTKPLTGWVDMHTHPMSHLGFGRKLMHGAPDIGSIIPAGTRFKGFNAFEKECNTVDERATSIEQALGTCNATHGGWGVENDCGNYVRAIVISKAFDDDFVYNVDHNPFTGGNLHGDHRHEGIETNPNFLYWPHQSSKAHQQMWWEWLKRAYKEGGLRVMVALSVNSELLAEVIDGDNPKDDKTTGDEQVDEIRDFVGRHNDFMEVAYSASDLRRIVSADKLAVIIGMEVDNIGNFNKSNVPLNEEAVKAEIVRLFDKGVRYIFPIHLTDNKFGGTAVYNDLFNYANKFSTGSLFTIQSSATIDPTITHRLGAGLDRAGNLGVKLALDAASGIPFPPALNVNPLDSRFCLNPTLGCWDKFKFIRNLISPDPRFFSYAATPGGHANAQGLTTLGVVAIKEMMRLGILIDIDHMSQKAVDSTLSLAEFNSNYPVNIGHNGLRGPSGNERGASQKTVERVAALGGVFGVGTADSEHDKTDAIKFINNVSTISTTVPGLRGIGLGTDVNGMERLPRASEGLNSDAFYKSFPKCTTGNRTWDYTKEGVAHYGLMADFIKDVKERNVNVYNKIMGSAEYFAQMWEKCDRLTTYRPTPMILPLHRLRNGGNHFYTVDVAERDNAIRSLGYVSEGTACSIFFNSQREGTVPLHRLRNGGHHFYTIDVAERDNAIRSLGYVSEGIAGHVYSTQRERSVPLYRLRNGGNHFYTTSAPERDNAIRSLGYVSEGIACYVFP
jgi:microsomal dipeptidase-like Zn-dependent dipeptidase